MQAQIAPQIARRVQTLLTLLIIVAAVFLLGVAGSFLAQFMGTFLLFFLAWLLAYLLKPIVRAIARTGLPFGLSALLVYMIVPVLALLAAFLLVPAISGQAAQISSHLGEYTNNLSGLLDYVKGALASLGMSAADIQGLQDKIRGAAGNIGQTVLQGGVSTVGSIGTMLFQVTLVLIFSISFLLDGDKLASTALTAIPVRWRKGATLLVKSVETSFGSFVRGQLLSGLAYALLNAAILLAFGLPYVAVGALATGLLIIVPLVGNYLAFIPPLVICLVVRSDATLVLFVVLVVVQGIYMNVVSPRIMAKAVNMHPLVTMGSILVFGQLGGFWGALFGIPIASTLSMLARPTLQLVHNYLNPDPEPDPQVDVQPHTQPQPSALAIVQDKSANGEGQPLGTSLSSPDETI